MSNEKAQSNDLAAKRNPIIGDHRDDTLHRAACVVAFLGRYHADRADFKFLDETSDSICGPDNLSSNAEKGLAHICETVAAALWFEVEGRV